MPTKDEIATAIKVVKEVSGNPTTGAIKELLDLLNTPAKEAKSFTPVAETRIAEVTETR
jgi:hypothetical protein